MAGERVVGFADRADENVRAPGELIHVDARGQRLRSVRSCRRETVALRPLTRRPADAGLLHAGVHRRQASEETQTLLALGEHVERVLQSHEPITQPLNLAGEQTVLALERAAAGDVHATRQRRAAQDEKQQRDHAADPDQRLDDGL